MDNTERILAAIDKSAEATKEDLREIWKELKIHSEDIAELKSTARLHKWQIAAVVGAIAGFGHIILKTVSEKFAKMVSFLGL